MPYMIYLEVDGIGFWYDLRTINPEEYAIIYDMFELSEQREEV